MDNVKWGYKTCKRFPMFLYLFIFNCLDFSMLVSWQIVSSRVLIFDFSTKAMFRLADWKILTTGSPRARENLKKSITFYALCGGPSPPSNFLMFFKPNFKSCRISWPFLKNKLRNLLSVIRKRVFTKQKNKKFCWVITSIFKGDTKPNTFEKIISAINLQTAKNGSSKCC